MTGQEEGGDLGQRSSERPSDRNLMADSDRTDGEKQREMMRMVKKKVMERDGMVGAISRQVKTKTLTPTLERVLLARDKP